MRAHETPETISLRYSGTTKHAADLRAANPGAEFSEGEKIVVPSSLLFKARPVAALSGELNASGFVDVVVNGNNFAGRWDTVQIEQALDRYSVVRLTGPFVAEDQTVRSAYRPFEFDTCEIYVDGRILFRGVLLGYSVQREIAGRSMAISAYSRAAVLTDVCASPAQFPLEYKGQTLRQIASSLIRPLDGLQAVFETADQAAFNTVALDPDLKIQSFLASLARKRNFVLSDTETGDLYFRRPSSDGNIKARLAESLPPVQFVSGRVNTQDLFSHITGLSSENGGNKPEKYTWTNPFTKGANRQYTFAVNDLETGSLKQAVDAKACRMFANAFYANVEVSTWYSETKELWKPGDLVQLTAPGAMVYTEQKLIVGAVSFVKNARAQTAELTLLLPGAYSGQIPEQLPWTV